MSSRSPSICWRLVTLYWYPTIYLYNNLYNNYYFIIDYGYLYKFIMYVYIYTGWLVTGGTSRKGVILREKRSRKYRIKIFRLRLCFRENRLWIFARYACTLSRLVVLFQHDQISLGNVFLIFRYGKNKFKLR